ncbi:MAG: isochorismatase family protein [Bifidobacteriaceae bacterium]|jgi:nicotinamidase-related amidase|nr:isochorismatase family protein [Bifidobacteriaceae bacterium]
MTSYQPRDPAADRLLSPGNAALVIIDYQQTQIDSLQSAPKELIMGKVVALAHVGLIFRLPIVLSTVNVQDGRNPDTIPRLKSVLKGVPSYDRTAINAWEDRDFVEAVKATGRSKLILAALWTEACLTFPSIDAMAEGFEVYPVVDAVGGTSRAAHRAALRRIEQAGARPTSITQLLCELQRDWNRGATLQGFLSELFATGAFPQY